MKVLLIATFIAVSAFVVTGKDHTRHTHATAREQQIKNVFDDLIEAIIKSLLESLTDPMEIGDIPLDFELPPYLESTGSLEGVKVTGTSGIEVYNVSTNLLNTTAHMKISIPELTLAADHYDIDAKIMSIFPVYGSGKFEIVLKDIYVWIIVQLRVQPPILGRVSMGNVDYEFKLGGIDSNIEGLFHDEELGETMNKIIEIYGPVFIDLLEPMVHDTITGFVVTAGDTFLANRTMLEIIGDLIG